MSDIETRLITIRSQIAAAQRAHGRAEHERDAAQAAATKAWEQLQRDFGVSTPDQVSQLLADLHNRRDHELARLSAQLDQAGG